MFPCYRMWVHSMVFKVMGHGCGDFISIALSFNTVQLSSKVLHLIALSFNTVQDQTSTHVSDSSCSNMIQPLALINDQRLIMTGVLRLHCIRVDKMTFRYGFSDEPIAGLHCLLTVTRRRSGQLNCCLDLVAYFLVNLVCPKFLH